MTEPAVLSQKPRSSDDTVLIPDDNRALTVRSYGLTDPGRKRPANEDQFLIAVLTKALQVQQTSLPQRKVQFSNARGYLFVVADGMGGHAGGAEASALAIDSLETFVLDALKWFFNLKGGEADEALNEFQAALRGADAKILREARHRPELRGMGTTVTLAYCFNDALFVAHVGDSRCYLLRGDSFYQLTRDHTMVQELIQRGLLKPEEAAEHHLRHVITNVVGGTDPGIRIDVHRAQLEPGDVVLLCSDGLTEMVPDKDIGTLLRDTPEPRAACERLVALANERGGKDNITVVVARFIRDEQAG